MKTFNGWVISLVTVLAIMGCGGGSSPPGFRGGPGEETEAAIVAEATQIAIDLTILSCTHLVCLDVTSQGDPLLFDQGRVETITCHWSCIPVQTGGGDERFVDVAITWERFVDRCYGEEEPIVVEAFEIPFLCTPNF